MSGWFYYVVNMFNLRLTAPLVEMQFKYTIREFTILKKLIFPRGGEIHINFVDDEYNDNMTMEEREFKSRLDFFCGCDDLEDDDYVNNEEFFDFM